jgi:hypothetical protein
VGLEEVAHASADRLEAPHLLDWLTPA